MGKVVKIITPDRKLYNFALQSHENAKNPAKDQIITRATTIRLVVTISRYLRRRNKAKYLSKLCAVIVNSDAQVNKYPAIPLVDKQKHRIAEKPFTLATRNATNSGWTTKLTPRSVKTRLPSRSLDGR